MELALKQLSECPEHLETVGLWIHNEWWSKRYDSPEIVLSWLRMHKKLDAVPYSVVALADADEGSLQRSYMRQHQSLHEQA
ncbi:MAG: hypothetical protein DME56_02630 [Verrucomicrobia bacterium]|nr:MAG: hypothetical protein DME56_02630 [Verrucomicrobiota bacterium]